MSKVWGFLLPRQRKDQMPASDQIAALRPVVYLTGDVCYAGIPGILETMQSGRETVRCGCIKCQPALWCRATDANGARCNTQACYPEGDAKPEYCAAHWREILRERRKQSSGGNGTTPLGQGLYGILAAFAKGAK